MGAGHLDWPPAAVAPWSNATTHSATGTGLSRMSANAMETLFHWNARAEMESRLLERGLGVPSVYQKIVQDFCGDTGTDLQEYWNEIAREHVSSGGQCDSWARRLPPPPAYRSTLLDELAARYLAIPNPLNVKLLHPCLIEFATKRLSDRAFGVWLQGAIREQKRREISALSLHVHKWSGSKRDLDLLLKDYAEALGFTRGKAQWHFRKVGRFKYGIRVDFGGGPSLLPSLPLEMVVADDSNVDLFFPISLDHIVPGFAHYGLFSSPEEAALGLFAHAVAMDLFASTLADG